VNIEQSAYHVPIMLNEVIQLLCKTQSGLFFDGTLGGGGHTRAILDYSMQNFVVATDRDEDAIVHASELLNSSNGRLKIFQSNFKDIEHVLNLEGIDKLDGALLDLGISSHQIDSAERGFSYRFEARLDMRMDRNQELNAHTIVNSYSVQQITDILRIYGEEKFAFKIANKIEKVRQSMPIDTTIQLVDIIRQCIPYHKSNGHPAKKTFQALRIYINTELQGLDKAILDIVARLNKGAIFCVITFHSLEDRIIKNVFKQLSIGCTCDKRIPVCVCGNQPTVSVVSKIIPSKDECIANKRAKSAILRSCIKL